MKKDISLNDSKTNNKKYDYGLFMQSDKTLSLKTGQVLSSVTPLRL